VEIDVLADGEFQRIPIVVNSGKTAYMVGACCHHGRLLLVVDHNRLLSRDEAQTVKAGIKAIYEAEEAERCRKEEEEAEKRRKEEESKEDEPAGEAAES
ncbi:MAG: hypothetical protein IKN95_03635, partial [Lachnospiraceae bacterium]|nr:hypothetical protein [Lachnospiraceae bacterium]